MAGSRAFWQRRFAPGTVGQLGELCEERAGARSLLVRLAGNPWCLKQLAHFETLSGVDGRALDAEVRTRHLRLVQLARLQRCSVGGRAQMAGSEQADERRVDRIPRPAIGRVGEMRA